MWTTLLRSFPVTGSRETGGSWRVMQGSWEGSIKREENTACLHTNGGQMNIARGLGNDKNGVLGKVRGHGTQ